MKILITGASGNVGRAISRDLSADHQVLTISRSAAEEDGISRSYALDFARQPGEVSSVLRSEKPDVIIHLASIVGRACETDPSAAHRINVDATRRLAGLASAAAVGKFIFFSSAAVYKQTAYEPTTEDANINPQSVYGRTKLGAEAALGAVAADAQATEFISLRPFNIYGPDFRNSLVYKLIHSTNDNPVPLLGFDNFYRDYVHISDIIQATRIVMDHAMGSPHTVLNVASGAPINNAALVGSLQRAGLQPVISMSGRDELNLSWADISSMKALGYNPKAEIIID